MAFRAAPALKAGGSYDCCSSVLQFIGVFEFGGVMSEVGVNTCRSSSFVPLVTPLDLSPVDTDFLEERDVVVGGRNSSDQSLAFECIAVFRDVINILLLNSKMGG